MGKVFVTVSFSVSLSLTPHQVLMLIKLVRFVYSSWVNIMFILLFFSLSLPLHLVNFQR